MGWIMMNFMPRDVEDSDLSLDSMEGRRAREIFYYY